jgi:hypothetical protein
MPTLKKIHPDDLVPVGKLADSDTPEQLCNLLLAGLYHLMERGALPGHIGSSEADRAVTWKDGVPIAVNVPGILQFEVLDLDFAKRSRYFPSVAV